MHKKIKEIADCTHINDHNGSVMLLAELLHNQEAIDKIKVIQKDHEQHGSMTWDLLLYRNEILAELLEQAKKHLKPVDFEAVENAF